ncbi:hypothetical protein [uncultured Collinsella sp.]|jgi:hypothetical protein|uniref:DUF5027 family lipoprotein n=1 Tax=uncultured Collinsella sp. TaxID=165190 RepID=UPI0025FCBE38|nr:hypothetical protein [uncultured Collinsella sp.]
MALSKSEKMSVVGIVVAAVIVASLFGVQHVMHEMQAQRVQEEKKSLDVSVGMGEPVQLDSATDGQLFEDGSTYSAGLLFDGIASVTVQSAKLYDSKEAIDALTGDPSWQGPADVSGVKGYLVCSVTFDNVDAMPLNTSQTGVPVFNAAMFNVNHGGEIAWMSAPVDRASYHDALNFEVPEGESRTFDILFVFYEDITPGSMQMWFGSGSVKKYRCDLTVDDCRG